MTTQDEPRRTVALLHSAHDPATYDALMDRHRLTIVYTVYTDAAAVLGALIAVQHALEHLADAVVIPHLGALKPRAPWWVITEAAGLITDAREYPMGSSFPALMRNEL
ncbi:hypothetical protein [Nocardia cyriacigeorgica]|uniref:hypothetical protein n=1 Tax=Nocardia cyriacigeorgica TaxID=135487 RepID=UPI00245461BD|nr:hypothetical protein [Nocardia cyriacigeorgica]